MSIARDHINSKYFMPFEGSHRALALLSVFVITVSAWCLVIAGKLDSTNGIAIPILACLASLLGSWIPQLVLTFLFASAPLLWALGEANMSQGGARVNLPMIIGLVVIIAFVPQLLIKESDPGIENIRKLVLIFILACIPAVFSSRDLFTGGGAYLRIICPFIVMFAVLRHTQSQQDVLRYARSMALGLVAVATVLAIAHWRSELWVDFGGYRRLSGLHLPTQDFALLLSVMVSVALVNYLLTRNFGYLLPLPFILTALYLTFYRTAWIGAGMFLVLFAFEVKKSYGRKLLMTGLIIGAIYLPIVSRSMLRYDTAMNSPELADKVLSGRLGVDAVAIQMYLDAPLYNKLFGMGFLRSREATVLVWGEEFGIHDDYLAFLIEAGVFALPVYLAILILLLKRSREGKRIAQEHISNDICSSASILVVTVIVLGVPGAFYTEVLSNLYIYGVIGLMLSQRYSVSA